MNRATFALAGTVTGLASLLAVKSQAIPVLNPHAATLVHEFGLLERDGSEGEAGGIYGNTSPTPAARTGVAGRSASRGGANGQERVADSESLDEEITTLGDPFNFTWGAVQVKVVTAGDRIVDVLPVRIPNTNVRNAQLAAAAVPVLRQRVLKAQATDVDVVTGATFTSSGYLQSVQSALDKVRGVKNNTVTGRVQATPTAVPAPGY